MKKTQTGRHHCYSPDDIFEIMHASEDILSYPQRFSLLYGDVAPQYELGSNENPLEVFGKYFPGSVVFHKSTSDVCLEKLRLLTYNENALVDLWIGTNAVDFVGTPDQSSMSDLIIKMRRYKGLDGFSYSAMEKQASKASHLISCLSQPSACNVKSSNFLRG